MSKRIEWDRLRLDPQNPRLPERLQGATWHDLVRHYLLSESADELVDSMIENGYFEHEPMLVRKEDNDTFTVLEGNRRLTAILLIMRPGEFEFGDILPEHDEEDLQRLEEIPCVVVEGRDEVRQLIGYRHIGGLKKWKPEAKARFILDEVQQAAERGEEDPFTAVGRRLGSNAQGIRNSYQALRTLLLARDEGIETAHVQYERFGVWQRAMNSSEVRDFIGLGNPRTYEAVESAVMDLDLPGLRRVMSDLTPGEEQRAVLSDSRDVTLYGRILANDRARDALSLYQSLDVPAQIVRQEALPERIRDLERRATVLVREVQEAEYSEELGLAVKHLEQTARTLRAAVEGLERANGHD